LGAKFKKCRHQVIPVGEVQGKFLGFGFVQTTAEDDEQGKGGKGATAEDQEEGKGGKDDKKKH
jgi:hypothetical protein